MVTYICNFCMHTQGQYSIVNVFVYTTLSMCIQNSHFDMLMLQSSLLYYIQSPTWASQHMRINCMRAIVKLKF